MNLGIVSYNFLFTIHTFILQLEFLLIIITIIILFAFLAIYLKSQISNLGSSKTDPTLTQWLTSMQQSIEKTNSSVASILNQNNKNVTDTLNKSNALINQRLDNALNIFGDVSREMSKMTELGKAMKDMQMILKSPKLRGNIGEEVLADMLGQVFPKNTYTLQYAFKSGYKVDAVIKTSAGLLSIDAKFPLENFTKKHKADTEAERGQYSKQFVADVKKHIKDISIKYILPEEDTVDFAFMYIPSETIFFEIANDAGLLDFARGNRIYPVSPNTLYAHLQTVLLAFEGQQFEKKAKAVMRLLQALQKDQIKMEENLAVLGKHINNASNQFNNAQQQFNVMGQKLQNRDLLEG